MAEDNEDNAPRDYATTDEVSAAAGVERGALGEWVRAGLLPAPNWTGGRGVIAKWPRSALKIAAFVRSQRELGFGLQDIRVRIVAAFGDRVLEILAEPRVPPVQAAKPKTKPKPKRRPRA
jgi:hypothetical protein